jgi:hypothetical protein
MVLLLSNTRGGVMILTFAVLLLGMQIDDRPHVEVDLIDGKCRVQLDGKPLDLGLLELETVMAQKPWPIQVRMSVANSTPYHCVAPVVQRMRIMDVAGLGFTQLPSVSQQTVRLTVPAWGCAPLADGRPVALDGLADLAREWKRDGSYVDFRPHPDAKFECVDAVLRQFRAANFQRLGFTGNGLAE